MRASLRCSLVVVLTLAWASSGRGQVIVPPNISGLVGGPVQASVGVSGLGDFAPPSLCAYDLGIRFDPLIVGFNGVAFGDPALGDQLNLSGLGTLTSVQLNGPGDLQLSERSLDPADVLDTQQTGDFTLFTIDFTGLEVGVSSVTASVNTFEDSAGNPLLPTGTTVAGSVSVVPEPSTFTLAHIALGTLGLVGSGWRREWAASTTDPRRATGAPGQRWRNLRCDGFNCS